MPDGGGVLDTLGMFDAALGLPEQVERAAGAVGEVSGPLPDHDQIENVVVLGAGACGLVGQMVRDVAGPFMPVPVVVHQGYGIPNFIGESTLVVAVSFSGDTAETLEAAGEALAAGGRLVVVSAGGELAELGRSWSVPVVEVEGALPAARAALGALAAPTMLLLEQLALFPGASGWIDSAVDQLRRRRDSLVGGDDLAQRLARHIGRELPLVYGGGGLGGLAARRWKAQLNENAKIPAFAGQLPELGHDEVAGWGQHGDVTRQVFRLVFLRHDHEHPQVVRAFDVLDELLAEVVAGIEVVRAQGEGALAQLFDLVLVGDLVSLHLAAQAGVDPGPVPAVELVQERLAGG